MLYYENSPCLHHEFCIKSAARELGETRILSMQHHTYLQRQNKCEYRREPVGDRSLCFMRRQVPQQKVAYDDTSTYINSEQCALSTDKNVMGSSYFDTKSINQNTNAHQNETINILLLSPFQLIKESNKNYNGY
jgi:hypothetical protein